MRLGRLLGALVLVASACSSPPGAAPSRSDRLPSESPGQSTAAPISFQPRHHFLAFVMDGQRLVFSGGDPVVKTSSPEIYSADPRTGAEELVAKASDTAATILSLASVRGQLIFAETWREGPVIYRVHSHSGGNDRLLDELIVNDTTLQMRYRATIPPPMVATDGTSAIWVSGRLVDDQPEYRLMATGFDGSAPRTLYSAREWIGYPRISGGLAYFTKALDSPSVWTIPLSGTATAKVFADGHSEAAPHEESVVTKFGGAALAPAGIALWNARGERQDLAPATALASEPSINERYVVWWGPTDKVVAVDRRSGRQVILGEALQDADGKRGIIGRQVAFPGVVVWLASPPGDLTVATANQKPTFQVLFQSP